MGVSPAVNVSYAAAGWCVRTCRQNVSLPTWTGHRKPASTTEAFFLPKNEAFRMLHMLLQHPEVDLLHGLRGHTITNRGLKGDDKV